MPKNERTRIDYMPGDAALDALALAGEMLPDTRPQALLDKLVITAVSALVHDRQHKRWEPPRLWGKNRDASTKQRCSFGRRKAIGYHKSKTAVCKVMIGKTTTVSMLTCRFLH